MTFSRSLMALNCTEDDWLEGAPRCISAVKVIKDLPALHGLTVAIGGKHVETAAKIATDGFDFVGFRQGVRMFLEKDVFRASPLGLISAGRLSRHLLCFSPNVGFKRYCLVTEGWLSPVEGTRLEIERGRDVTVGSNPTPSAKSSGARSSKRWVG